MMEKNRQNIRETIIERVKTMDDRQLDRLAAALDLLDSLTGKATGETPKTGGKGNTDGKQ